MALQKHIQASGYSVASPQAVLVSTLSEPNCGKIAPLPRTPGRNSALDFTKGMLVLLMVLYHWLNYFVASEGDFYRYLRFVTPSFIFITGFLISNVYLSKYQVSDPRLPKRLSIRGLKILGVFVGVNMIISLLLPTSYDGNVSFIHLSIRQLVALYVTGNVATATGKAAAFYILIPISYLLLLSSVLVIACRFYRYVFHLLWAACVLCILSLELKGLQSANLELLTIGLLGVILGYVSLARINAFIQHPYTLIGIYLCYIAAIYIWNVIYPLQVIGVCLSVALIYLLGAREAELSRTRRHIILLGKYSLFGYMAQIAILQLLFRGLRHVHLGSSGLLLTSFFAAFALTMMSVEALNRARERSGPVDSVYKAVFS